MLNKLIEAKNVATTEVLLAISLTEREGAAASPEIHNFFASPPFLSHAILRSFGTKVPDQIPMSQQIQ